MNVEEVREVEFEKIKIIKIMSVEKCPRQSHITWILSVVAISCNDHGYYNNGEGLQPSSFWLQ
jgi:hypothetical protein